MAEKENSRIQVFDPNGRFIEQYTHNSFGASCAVGFNKTRSKLFATDDFTLLKQIHRGSDIFVFDTAKKVKTRFGRSGSYQHLINNAYVLPFIHLLLGINLAASLYLALKEKQYGYAVISLLCAAIFIINKVYLHAGFLNIITCIVLVGAALRVRAIQVYKRQCLFKQEDKVVC